MGTAGDPSQGKETENHGVEKLQETQWSGRKCQAVRTRPQPPACLKPPSSPRWRHWDGLSVTEAKTGQAETRKGRGDTGTVLDLSPEKEEEEGLFVCLFHYLCSLFANT